MYSKISIDCSAAEDTSRGGLTYHCNIGQANFSKPWSREYSSQYTNHYMHRKKLSFATWSNALHQQMPISLYLCVVLGARRLNCHE